MPLSDSSSGLHTFKVEGDVMAAIDESSDINLNTIELTASDSSAIGAYAIAGSVAGQSSNGKALGVAGVGAGAGNTIERAIKATIGTLEQNKSGDGIINAKTLTLTAERTAESRIIADTAGAAIAAALTSGTSGGAMTASLAGGFAFNTLKGGITAGVYNIKDLQISGETTIIARATAVSLAS